MLTTMITGGGGFIGSHVMREARRQGAALTVMSHRRQLAEPGLIARSAPLIRSAPAGRSAPPLRSAPPARVFRADLADPSTLRGVCEGVGVLLHCASQIGGTPEANEAVNARGTAALVAEAQRAGVSRIVYVSTASVYGRGSFRGALPEQLTRSPGSPTSRTRAAAEDAVLAAGGIVLRPHLVYGRGDTTMMPGVVRLLRTLPGGVTGWSARMSVISASELASLLVAVGSAPAGSLTSSVYHAAHPRPVTAAELLGAAARCAGLPRVPGELTVAQARAHLEGDAYATHAIDMLATDHWFDGSPLWADLRRVPGPGFQEGFPGMREWYEDLVPAA
ncbi:NAD-dependent epimerase/dehydratase family protein [Streptomyces sp. NPDC059443]|uniref:NAD-dependent epimerase/dehydratase family protein n=1 Tax=unclassified Streptomyces TaxID=2593676 RepID=UPI0036BC133A